MIYESLLIRLLGTIPANVGAVLLMTLACYGVGRLAVRGLLPHLRGRELLLSLVSGGVLWALCGLAAGNGLIALPVWVVCLLPAVAAVWGCMEFYRAGSPVQSLRNSWEIWLTLLLLGGWFFASAELLPYSWDEQTYQIAVPAMWLQTGSIAPVRDLPYSAFPLMPQFLLLWLFKLGGIGTARLLILGAFLLLFYGVYDELRACAGRLTAGAFTLLFILSPLPGAMIREFYAEVFLALLMLAAVRTFRKTEKITPGCAVFLGMLAGGAAAVKLTGLGVSLAVGAVLLQRRIPRKSLLFFAGAGAVFAVFYLRSWIVLGNPVYPFFDSLFGGSSSVVGAYHTQDAAFATGVLQDINAFHRYTLHSASPFRTPAEQFRTHFLG